MRTPRLLPCAALALSLLACGGAPVVDARDDGGAPRGAPDAPPVDAPAPEAREVRVADRAVVAWMRVDSEDPWWIEERLAPEPAVRGDRGVGPRSVVRGGAARAVVWSPPDADRLTAAVSHPSGEWSAVGVDAERRVFLARGGASGLLDRRTLDDPELATDPRAWLGAPRDALRVGALSEASVAVAADGEDVVVALMSEDFAVLAYRWRREGGAYVRGPRTLVSPAVVASPFLPIGGSFDTFSATVGPYLTHLAVDARGRAFVAVHADRQRLTRHNAVLGTSLELVRERLGPRENSSDALVTRVDRDGSVGFARVVGTPDVEDEVFGLAVGASRVAVLGRSRRELGRDNTELHAMVSELDLEGVPRGTVTFDARASALAQSGVYEGEDLWVGGSEGWTQNPSGRSVLTPGRPLLLRLRDGASGRVVERADALLPQTEGHSELRALAVYRGAVFLGGHERGPLTHTGDGDRALVRADAWWCVRAGGVAGSAPR